jgi:hypothetical protein
LTAFYRKVRPFGPGWAEIRSTAGPLAEEGDTENIPMALLGWVAGCAAIWSALFAVGNFLYGRTTAAVILTAIFIVSGLTVMRIVSRLWTGAVREPAPVR